MPILNTALTLKDLPLPPPGKSGWPWTEQTKPLPERMSDGSEWPRISVVTPSFNQGQFIEETIRSVLLQGYPNLEYIIIDGGSTDNTIEVIKKYERHISYWVSEPDKGQSNALNKGFKRATGEWIGWQNSDDYYLPKALEHTIQEWKSIKRNIGVIYGNVLVVDKEGNFINFYPVSSSAKIDEMIPYAALGNQSTFFCRQIFKDAVFVDELLQHALDLEFFFRLASNNYKFHFNPNVRGCVRMQPHSKTSTQDNVFAKEYFQVYKKIYFNSSLSADIRSKAMSCIIGITLDNFGKSRFLLFRRNTLDLIHISGFKYLTIELLTKYLVSFLGENNIIKLKQVKASILGRNLNTIT